MFGCVVTGSIAISFRNIEQSRHGCSKLSPLSALNSNTSTPSDAKVPRLSKVTGLRCRLGRIPIDGLVVIFQRDQPA